VSSQGVWQVCPEEVFTSAPAGSDSIFPVLEALRTLVPQSEVFAFVGARHASPFSPPPAARR
jgi:hypothetical protein